MRRPSHRWTPLLLALLALGCVTPMTEQQVEEQLEKAAAPVTGRSQVRVYPIWAETKLIAFALLTEAKSDPGSSLSLNLSRRIALAAKRRQSVVVGGPYANLADRVLRNALELNREDGLRGVKLVYVSPEAPSRALADTARQVRARLYHRELR